MDLQNSSSFWILNLNVHGRASDRELFPQLEQQPFITLPRTIAGVHFRMGGGSMGMQNSSSSRFKS